MLNAKECSHYISKIYDNKSVDLVSLETNNKMNFSYAQFQKLRNDINYAILGSVIVDHDKVTGVTYELVDSGSEEDFHELNDRANREDLILTERENKQGEKEYNLFREITDSNIGTIKYILTKGFEVPTYGIKEKGKKTLYWTDYISGATIYNKASEAFSAKTVEEKITKNTVNILRLFDSLENIERKVKNNGDTSNQRYLDTGLVEYYG